MESLKKVGIAVVILLFLMIITPKISAIASKSIRRVWGLSFNDFSLIILSCAVILLVLYILFSKRPLSLSSWRFRKLYKPKSDMQRLREYIKERKAKETDARIRHTLLKVGWDDKTIDSAFKTYKRARLIKFKRKPVKKSKRRTRK